MCEVGQRLYDEELQHSIVMENYEGDFMFYLHESTTYINNINSLGMNGTNINRFFELGLDLSNDTYTVEGFINHLVKIHHF